MKAKFISMCDMADGYFGKRTIGALCFDPLSRKTLFVWAGGFFNAGLPDCTDEIEADYIARKFSKIGRLNLKF